LQLKLLNINLLCPVVHASSDVNIANDTECDGTFKHSKSSQNHTAIHISHNQKCLHHLKYH